ncbi:MAG: ATP-binding protein [Prolixibacteraceae bacterium]|nr:ATP-binding protein [Prolixibacteraceae bacterium]
MEKKFIVENRIEELPLLFSKIEELGEMWNLSLPLTMNINLVLEEAVSNVIFYAFNDEKRHEIIILVSLENEVLKIEIIDDGLPFDPTNRQMPDVTLSAEDREIGGLGIYLIKQIMDTVEYARVDNNNILTLTKKI